MGDMGALPDGHLLAALRSTNVLDGFDTPLAAKDVHAEVDLVPVGTAVSLVVR